MHRNKKIIIGILTFLPLIFFIWYAFSFISIFKAGIGSLNSGPQPTIDLANRVSNIFLPMILLFVVSFGLLIYYLVDILSLNKKFKKGSNDKIVWVLVVFFGGFIGMIVYFFVEIVPRGRESIAAISQEPSSLESGYEN